MSELVSLRSAFFTAEIAGVHNGTALVTEDEHPRPDSTPRPDLSAPAEQRLVLAAHVAH